MIMLVPERIIMHSADYVSEEQYTAWRYPAGLGEGCPAIPETLNAPSSMADQGRKCLFLYAPDKRYVRRK